MNGFRASARGKRGEIVLYADIGEGPFGDGIGAQAFDRALKGLGAVDAIDVRINSYGGDVFAGLTMYNRLVEHPARIVTHVDGLAASAASVILMAGDEIVVADGAFVMIHDAFTRVVGNAAEMRTAAERLDAVSDQMAAIYARRARTAPERIRELMAAETWFSGSEAVAAGLADRVAPGAALAARLTSELVASYRNVPQQLRPRAVAASAALARMRMNAAARTRG